MDNPAGPAGALIKFVLASTPRGGLKTPLAIARRLLQKGAGGWCQRNNMRPPVLGSLAWELDSVGADLTPAQFAYLAAALAGENQQLDYRAKGIIRGRFLYCSRKRSIKLPNVSCERRTLRRFSAAGSPPRRTLACSSPAISLALASFTAEALPRTSRRVLPPTLY